VHWLDKAHPGGEAEGQTSGPGASHWVCLDEAMVPQMKGGRVGVSGALFYISLCLFSSS